jgi:ketosteroid isomerase-like protein
MSDLDEFRTDTLARQTEAEAAFVHGDPEPRMELWSRDDPVTLFGAGSGDLKSGWEDVTAIFRWITSTFSDVSDFRFDVEVADVSGDMAYTVGYERFTGSIDGRPVAPVTVRVTHVYRREDGRWRIVHRHGDSATFDQSPLATSAD